MIKGIAHVCFVARDLEQAIDFYQNKLGLAHAFDFRDDTGRRTGVYLSTGNRSFIEIFESAHEDYAETQSYKHLCLEVDDIEKAVAELVARGVETTPPFFGDDNSWQAWLTDPDGNRIELHAYTPKSKQLGGG